VIGDGDNYFQRIFHFIFYFPIEFWMIYRHFLRHSCYLLLTKIEATSNNDFPDEDNKPLLKRRNLM
jgi:hypothetical protein